jgi:hypothetical protein
MKYLWIVVYKKQIKNLKLIYRARYKLNKYQNSKKLKKYQVTHKEYSGHLKWISH